jgi:hypothetical protein
VVQLLSRPRGPAARRSALDLRRFDVGSWRALLLQARRTITELLLALEVMEPSGRPAAHPLAACALPAHYPPSWKGTETPAEGFVSVGSASLTAPTRSTENSRCRRPALEHGTFLDHQAGNGPANFLSDRLEASPHLMRPSASRGSLALTSSVDHLGVTHRWCMITLPYRASRMTTLPPRTPCCTSKNAAASTLSWSTLST